MPEAAISRSASRLVVLKAVRSSLAAPGIEMWTSRTARPLSRIAGQQARDEIAMHGAGVAAGAVLQHAEAIDDDIDLALADQPRQRGCVHRHDRQFEIEGAGLLRRREMPRDADRVKAPHAQIVGDEPPDQAGGAEHEDLSRQRSCSHAPPKTALRSSATGSP